MPCPGFGGDRGSPRHGRAGSHSLSAPSYIDRCMRTPGSRPIPPDAHDRLGSRAGWRVRAAGSLPQPRCRTSKFPASDRLSKGPDRHGGQRPRVTRPWLSHWTSKAASNWQREPTGITGRYAGGCRPVSLQSLATSACPQVGQTHISSSMNPASARSGRRPGRLPLSFFIATILPFFAHSGQSMKSSLVS